MFSLSCFIFFIIRFIFLNFLVLIFGFYFSIFLFFVFPILFFSLHFLFLLFLSVFFLLYFSSFFIITFCSIFFLLFHFFSIFFSLLIPTKIWNTNLWNILYQVDTPRASHHNFCFFLVCFFSTETWVQSNPIFKTYYRSFITLWFYSYQESAVEV